MILAGLPALPAAAQVPNSPIVFASSAITTTFVPAPQLQGGVGSGAGSDAQWLKVEFHYSVVPKDPAKFVDSAQFHIWIEGRDLYAANAPTSDGVAVGLTGSITYVNLAATRDAYGVFYVPPATLARYSTSRGFEDFDRTFNIHIEADVGGGTVDYFDKNKESDSNWYKTLVPVPGLVYRQDQSPFIVTDPDRYPPIKLPTETGQ